MCLPSRLVTVQTDTDATLTACNSTPNMAARFTYSTKFDPLSEALFPAYIHVSSVGNIHFPIGIQVTLSNKNLACLMMRNNYICTFHLECTEADVHSRSHSVWLWIQYNDK